MDKPGDDSYYQEVDQWLAACHETPFAPELHKSDGYCRKEVSKVDVLLSLDGVQDVYMEHNFSQLLKKGYLLGHWRTDNELVKFNFGIDIEDDTKP